MVNPQLIGSAEVRLATVIEDVPISFEVDCAGTPPKNEVIEMADIAVNGGEG
jgi:hypothetical protein